VEHSPPGGAGPPGPLAHGSDPSRGDQMAEAILSARKLNKSFGPVHVLHDVDLDVYPGEVTALVGDNGAGKSTLVKCFAGINSIDSGEIVYEGKPVTIADPRAATALGIEFVYQDLALADNLDITQNMFLGRELTTLRALLSDGEMEKQARATLASLSVRTVSSVRQLVSNLSGGQRQTVAIAKAVLWNSKVVFLDEPTAALGVAQTRQVLDLVRRLADQGRGVVLISHNMNDVMEVADRVVALYLGRVAAEVKTADTSTTQIVELITAGRSGDIGLAASTADQSA
jgi:D-xylose transport system ATP-binding protein